MKYTMRLITLSFAIGIVCSLLSLDRTSAQTPDIVILPGREVDRDVTISVAEKRAWQQLSINSQQHAAGYTRTDADCSVEYTGDNVTDLTSADASALQQAVDIANPGTKVKVAGTCAGVQLRDGMTQTVFITRSITLQGGYAATDWQAAPDTVANPTMVDAQGAGRVVFVSDVATVTLDSLTIINGDTDRSGPFKEGGGVRASSALTISNTVLQGNDAFRGGGAWGEGPLTVIDSIIRLNNVDLNGAGLASLGDLAISGSDIISNTAENRGAGFFSNGEGSAVVITDTTISGNISLTGDGGGGYIREGGALTMTTSIVVDNLAGGDGGGLYLKSDSSGTIRDVSISHNSAIDDGGGIFAGGELRLLQSQLVNNLTSDNGGGLTIADGGQAIVDESRFIDNFSSVNGGGLYAADNGLKLAVTDSQFINNAASWGGGLFLYMPTTITDTVVQANEVVNGGGGLFLLETTVDIHGSLVQGNGSNVQCGGINNQVSVLTITSSQIISNTHATTGGGGGGLCNVTAEGVPTTVIITDSLIANNSTVSVGGGILNFNNGAQYSLTIRESTIRANFAAFYGGGISSIGEGTVALDQSTMNANQADGEGGGISLLNGAIFMIDNSTISGNQAPVGGGIFNNGAILMNYATIAKNLADLGGGIYQVPPDPIGRRVTSGSTVVEGSIVSGNIGGNCAGLQLSSSGNNMDSDGSCGFNASGDLFNTNPLLQALADNGGPTATHSFFDGSSAIDHIPTGVCTQLVDQRGINRPNGSGCDIGALEVNVPVLPRAPLLYLPTVSR